MVKRTLLLTGFVFVFSLSPAQPARANFVEDMVDVSHTIGKSKQERERIILERRARRFAKKTGKSVNDGVKAAGKAARTLGKNVRTAINKKYPERD